MTKIAPHNHLIGLTRLALLPLFILALLMGCSSQPVAPTTEPPPEPPVRPEILQITDRAFDSETLYALLVAEIAGERGRFDVMLNNYVQQAQVTRDPGVTARATRVARFLNAHGAALETALLWTELEPYNPEAHFNAAAELMHANRLLEAFEHSRFLLVHGEMSGLDALGAQAVQGEDRDTSEQLAALYQELAQQYPQDVELLIGLSLLLQHSNQTEKALASAERAAALAPNRFQPQVQKIRVLQQMGQTEKALTLLSDLVRQHPENSRLRLQYARSLMHTDLSEAQQQIETLLEASPDDSDLILTLALVQYEQDLWEAAAEQFAKLVDDEQRRSTAHYYLGRIAVQQGDDDRAITHLGQVEPGADYLPAMAQLAELFVQQGQLEVAVALIRDQRQVTPEDRQGQLEGLYLLEAQLLSQTGHSDDAKSLLNEAIEHLPDATRLLYTRGLLLTQMDDLAGAEADFQRVLAQAPDNAATLNALGYTLADRTDRIDEAYEYILRAYQLSPDDPAIIDSMGWVEYKRGNYAAALEKLRQAMNTLPDHEIAAHLGEVLWVTGEQDEARKIWREGLKLNPTSSVIRDTLERFNVEIKD